MDFEQIFDSVPDLQCVTDEDGIFLRVNAAWTEQLGWERADMEGRHFSEFVHPQDIPKTRTAIIELGDHGTKLRFYNRFKTKAEGYHIIEWTSANRPSTGMLYTVGRDISKSKETESALEMARKAAEEANHAKTVFLANMSHEIRTPLNGVIGLTQLLSRTELDPKQSKFVAALMQSSEALLHVIDDVLDISRIESGVMEITSTELDITQVLEQAVEAVSGLAEHKGLELICEIEPGLPAKVLGDEKRIKQIVLNLLGNALKFTPEGWVRLDACWQDDRLMVRVTDSGPGIGAEAKTVIFERFVQGSEGVTKTAEGSGLGLSICRELAAMMGGSISLTDPQPERGAQFCVELPLKIIA